MNATGIYVLSVLDVGNIYPSTPLLRTNVCNVSILYTFTLLMIMYNIRLQYQIIIHLLQMVLEQLLSVYKKICLRQARPLQVLVILFFYFLAGI